MVVIEEVEVTPEKICGKCEKDLTAAGIKPQRCSRCKKIYYCSRDCQAKDWKFHKKDCKKQGTEKTEAKKNRTYDSAKGEDIGEIMTDHARFEKAFNTTKESKGMDNIATLDAAFDLIDSYIGLYKLEPCDALLTEIFPVCLKQGEGGTHHIKAIQSRAFLRFKQHRFQDALDGFLEFRKYAGPSAELMENTGHAYNSLGKLKEAEESFLESLKLADMPGASVRAKSNRGGVLLGLGLVKDRLGNTKEGLKVLYEALEFYKQRFQGVDHSLIAKTLMSIGHTHEKLREFSKAEESFREAMRIFKATCGDDTPLTANAVHSLAKIVKKDNDRFEECRQLLLESLSAYVSFDTLHVYLNIICEIATAVVRLQVAASKQDQKSGGNSLQTLNAVFKPFVAPVLKCRKRIIQNSIDDGQGTVAVFYKTSGEILMLSGMYVDAVKVLSDATDLLEKITILDVSHLVNECKSMSAFATSQIAIHSIK